MQLTRFDRWLREKFVYEIHIQTLRAPEAIPRSIRIIELPDTPGRRYKYLLTTTNSKAADKLIQTFKENNQMYATQIVDRNAWYVPFIAPKDKSLTWWLVSVALFATGAFFVLLYIKGLAQDEEFRKDFMEALEVLKG
jgi:hypothetical protein